MVGFKLFPRNRRPSLGELLGISQASHQISRKHHLRIVREPIWPLKNNERGANWHAGYFNNSNASMKFARFLRRLFR